MCSLKSLRTWPKDLKLVKWEKLSTIIGAPSIVSSVLHIKVNSQLAAATTKYLTKFYLIVSLKDEDKR